MLKIIGIKPEAFCNWVSPLGVLADCAESKRNLMPWPASLARRYLLAVVKSIPPLGNRDNGAVRIALLVGKEGGACKRLLYRDFNKRS